MVVVFCQMAMDAATGSVAFALDAAMNGCYHAELKEVNGKIIVINYKSVHSWN